MAVARVEWECPGCQKRYAIREDIPQPELCPACQDEQRAIADAASQLEPEIPLPSTLTDRRYRPLRLLALALEICGVLAGVIGLVGLTTALIQGAVPVVADSAALAACLYGVGYFAIFILAFAIYAAGGALELLIEIEHHTRLGRSEHRGMSTEEAGSG